MAVPVNLKEVGYILLLLLVLGGLLVLFQGSAAAAGIDGFVGSNRCDLDNPCAAGLKCLNGFCAKTTPLEIVESDPVPLLPPGGPAPYF
jgi:hypothetical protein